jgi:hypothetical protein
MLDSASQQCCMETEIPANSILTCSNDHASTDAMSLQLQREIMEASLAG